MAGTTFATSVTSPEFIGAVTGAVTGGVTGDVTGDVTGALTGDSAGVHTGPVDFQDTDPLVAGQWWDNAGTLTKSTGS